MKNKKYIFLIFIFSICIMLPSLTTGYIKGHDTNFHVANISAISNQLSFKNWLAKEPLPFIANDFGYGTRFFYPPIPHLLASYINNILTVFNIYNVAIAMRITQWFCIFGSGITFFYLSLKIFKKEKVAILLSLFYMTVPYHLSEIFVRDAFSEMFIPIAIPLIVLGLLYLMEEKYNKFLFNFIIGYTLAIYSHMAMSIYFTLIILLTFFTVYFKKIFNKKNILFLMLASLLILLLTSSFWLPLLEIKIKGSYGVFMPYYMTGKGDLRYSAISILELINYTHPYTYDFIRFNIQLFVVIMFFISLILIIKHKLFKNKLCLFLLFFTLLSMIMITKLFPWYYTPDMLQTLQFPWRLVIYVDFGVILISGIFLKNIESIKKFNLIFILLIIISLFSSYYYTNHLNESILNINDIDYNLGVGNSSEYLPEKVLKNKDYYNNRSNDIIKLSGNGDIEITYNKTPNLNFSVNNSSNLIIEFPRLYYMGYSLNKNGNKIEIEQSENGFLKASVSDGLYELRYKKTNIMKISNFISLFTFIILFLYTIKSKKFKST